MNKGTSDIQAQLGRNIATARKSAKMTQERLAELVDLQTLSISRIERGAVAPSIATLSKIADVINVPISRLFVVPKSTESLATNISEMLNALPKQYHIPVYEQMKSLCSTIQCVLHDSAATYTVSPKSEEENQD